MFEVYLTAAQARTHFGDDFPREYAPFHVQSRTAVIDGCQEIAGTSFRQVVWNNDMDMREPMTTPMPPPDDPDTTPEPGSSWMPECRWTCDTTSPSGWIRVDSQRTALPNECPTPFQFNICRYDDRPVGNMLSVCSSETTPAGWSTLSVGSDVARCVGGASSSNVKLIQRRE